MTPAKHEVIKVDAWGLKLDIPANKKSKAIVSILFILCVLIVGWHNLNLDHKVENIQTRLEECEQLERQHNQPWVPQQSHAKGFALLPEVANR